MRLPLTRRLPLPYLVAGATAKPSRKKLQTLGVIRKKHLLRHPEPTLVVDTFRMFRNVRSRL